MIADKVKCLLGFHAWDWVYEASDSCNQVKICSRCNVKSKVTQTEHVQRERKWDLNSKIFVQVCQRCGDKVSDWEGNQLVSSLKENSTCESAAVQLIKIGNPAVEPLISALKHEHERVRQLAAWALGQIRNSRAVEPILNVLHHDQSAWVRLACYEALKQLSNVNISESVTQELVESVATEIRRLYSITVDDGSWVTEKWVEEVQKADIGDLRRKYGSYFSHSDEYEEVERESTKFVKTGQHVEPDIDGIRKLIAEIPIALRDQVQVLSGMSKDLFESWSD